MLRKGPAVLGQGDTGRAGGKDLGTERRKLAHPLPHNLLREDSQFSIMREKGALLVNYLNYIVPLQCL